jgi:NAD(P)-dependent dehydrogenase (short-subunit alcohol dehydrogenase family)
MTLDGKRLIITGAASGIGRATAELATESGAQASLFDVDSVGLATVRRDLDERGADVRTWTFDLSDAGETERRVREAARWMGGVDVLLHVAGVMQGQGFLVTDLPDDVWERVISINLTATFLVAKYAALEMMKAGGGAIILTGSGAGVAWPSGSAAYGASKGGVHGLAITLEKQLAPYGIRVNEVQPGFVDTPLLRRSVAEGLASGMSAESYTAIDKTAVGPPDIAKVMVFLASDDASHVRGVVTTR